MIDIAIVTERACLSVNPEVKYSAMGVEENTILKNTFTSQNINCEIVAWDDPEFDWSTTKLALIRTTWNYFYLIPEFRNWVKNTAEKCKLINSEDLVLWNMDKHYLFDLQEKGIRIPETYILQADALFDPDFWMEKFGTKGFVVKPTISGGSKDTYFVKPPFDDQTISSIKKDVKRQQTMVQAFVPSIVKEGEVSIMFIDGNFTHAMIKRPKSNDFRVQPYHGGTHNKYIPNENEIAFGKRVLKACEEIKGSPLYARIDFCYSDTGKILLMELEIIEPQLWLPETEKALTALQQAIKNLL